MKNLKHVFSLTILMALSFNSHAEVFKLTESKMAAPDPDFPPATIKTYQAMKPVHVTYRYYIDAMQDRPELLLSYDEKQTSITDLLTYGSFTENLDSTVVKNKILKKIPKLKDNDECAYEGKAILRLKDIQILTPETAGEVDTSVTIVDVININPPRKKCQ